MKSCLRKEEPKHDRRYESFHVTCDPRKNPIIRKGHVTMLRQVICILCRVRDPMRKNTRNSFPNLARAWFHFVCVRKHSQKKRRVQAIRSVHVKTPEKRIKNIVFFPRSTKTFLSVEVRKNI